jgi:hypothetical protein
MRKKILKDLEQATPTNLVATRVLFQKLHSDMDFCVKKRDFQGLQIIQHSIKEFLSANKSRFHIERQNYPGRSYRIRRFLEELDSLQEKCHALLVK